MKKLLKIDTVYKDRFFFDQYEYCLNFKMPEMSSLRGLDHAEIDRLITYRNTWKVRNPNFGGSWRARRQEITEEERANCHTLCDFLLARSDQFKLTISTDWAYIYSNNLSMLRSLENLDCILPLSLKQAIIDRPRDTLLIRNSQHQYRSYFRAQRISHEQKVNLANFLKNQKDIRLGPGLSGFISDDQKYHYMNDNNFIDHDEQGILLMLEMVLPRSIRKTVKLIRHK